jgi:hypothetical protein
MSLYQVQKLLYGLNRDPRLQERYRSDRRALLDEYRLDDEERQAFKGGDVGLLYVLGAHPSLLVHFGGLVGLPLSKHRECLVKGVEVHGPVRAGLLSGPAGRRAVHL